MFRKPYPEKEVLHLFLRLYVYNMSHNMWPLETS